MTLRGVRWVTSLVAAGVLVAATSLMMSASPASANGTSTIDPTFLLAIGASVSVGVQPTLRHDRGQPTRKGYANDLITMLAAKGTPMQLIQTGCPGETTQQVLYGGDHCYARGDSQLLRAVAFLRTHQNQGGVVTLDLGFNDLHGCLLHENVDMTCVSARMNLLSIQLPQVITALKAAAGPHVTFIGINHYNPYLARALSGSSGERFAVASVPVINLLNSTLAMVYGQSSIPVADVAARFRTSDTTPVTVDGIGTVGENLAQTCALTWMCQEPPYGPNLHPNDQGYQTIADAIAAVLPAQAWQWYRE
ncbi:MAG: SGNH/GDSL hydrolase family protein [Acidimicrobiaceae bacterium]|nr:SGNH/GDSL hydrolase family protein [Acidimicrobiaceae bacterium]